VDILTIDLEQVSTHLSVFQFSECYVCLRKYKLGLKIKKISN